MIGHRIMGLSLMTTGYIVQSLPHYNRAIALYDPVEHRALAGRFAGVDVRVSLLTNMSWVLWWLGYPESALADVDYALRDAREVGQAATVMYALGLTTLYDLFCGNYEAARAKSDELMALADKKSALFWKARGMMNWGCILAVTGKSADAVQMISSGQRR
jgi:hypothetical protein